MATPRRLSSRSPRAAPVHHRIVDTWGGGLAEKRVAYDLHADRTTFTPHAAVAPVASVAAFVRGFFLPTNYPRSVTRDYLEFQVWDTIQAVTSYLRGTLTVRAIMAGVGVGSAEATATSAAIVWVLKDGVGMFGGMLFAWSQSQCTGAFAMSCTFTCFVIVF
jgi:hypothetical protein